MNVDELLTLKQLAEKTGRSVEFFRGIVERGEVAVIRRTPRGRIHITETAYKQWQASHTSEASARMHVDVPLDPPKKSPLRTPDTVSIDHLITPGFKSPIARSY